MLDRTVADIGRIQALVPDEESRNMSRKMKRFNKTFIGDSEPNDWRWIKTLAGSGDLPARRDFELPPGSDFMNVGAIPGGIVVALDDDTCFYIFGWNHSVAMRSDRKLLILHKGDVFVYRGDLVFSPVGYEVNNVYLHAYLDTPMVERPEDHQPVLVPMADDTARFEDPFCFAWNCTFRGTGSPFVRRHLNRLHGFRFHHAPHTTAA